MKKKFFQALAAVLALTMTLASCSVVSNVNVETSEDGYLVVNGEKTEHKVDQGGANTQPSAPVVTVEDGYLVVNGEKTEYKVDAGDENPEPSEPVVTVEDGYLVVNGVKTEHKVDTDDEITVEDGYLVVNGVKTEHKVDTADVITVVDGYLVVNGVKTEHKVDTVDEITVTVVDGYLAVNGVKTEHKVEVPHTHSFGEWTMYGEAELTCENRLYSRICADCATIEWKQGTAEDHVWTVVTTPPTCQAGGFDTRTCDTCGKVETVNETPVSDHAYPATFESDNSFHWQDCVNCDHTTEKVEHELGDDGICTVCEAVIGATEGIVYDMSADGTYAMVITYTGTAKRVRIAEEYNGVPVTEIYNEAFSGTNITSVVIPDSVITIGSSAFSGCSRLAGITIPDSVTTIGYSAFSGCSRLAGITIPDSVTTIDREAFSGCTNLITEYEFCRYVGSGENPYHVLIGTTNQNLSAYTIHEDTKIIAELAFYGCYRLAGITIPDSVIAIGGSVFSHCSSLTSVEIGDSVTTIGGGAFYNCDLLTSVVIPDSVTTIGVGGFEDCSSLISVVIPNSVTTIGGQAFYNCSSLTSVEMGDSVTTIGDHAFQYCTSLTSMVIPDSVTTIGYSAFDGCYSLTSVYYTGTAEEWEEIGIADSNYCLIFATRYYYSETAPAEVGNYWHYVDGVPTPW